MGVFWKTGPWGMWVGVCGVCNVVCEEGGVEGRYIFASKVNE